VGRFVQDNSTTVACGPLVLPGRPEVAGAVLERQAAALAAVLERDGLRPGDRVAIATADAHAFFVTFAACLASGWTAVVVDPLAADDEIRRMFRRAAPRAAVVDEAVAVAQRATGGQALPAPAIVVGIDAARSRRAGSWLPWRGRTPQLETSTSFETVTAGGGPLTWRALNDEVPAYVMFTSGTTSTPKGVVISRRALFHHVRTLADVFGYGDGATLLHYLPFHHTDGLVHGPAAALLTGMRVVRPGAFTPQAAAALPELLRSERITHLIAVPTMLAVIHRTLGDRRDLFQTGSFRHLVSTAGYLNADLWQRVEAAFGLRLSNFYGMTETVSGSLYCGPADPLYKRDTLGRPVDCALRIVDDAGAPCPPGQAGRLEIAGEHLMDGYLDDPEASAAVLRDGWLDTGDLFRIDDDGFYVFVGRRKTVIKRGGITIHPEDVRRALEAVPWVREVEVVGVDDATFEQIVVACVVLDPGRTAADVHAECARRLAPERRPDRVTPMADLPRGPSGKVQRDALLARLAQTADEASQETSVAETVRTTAARIFQIDVATLSDATTPDDVPNWDSYAQIELAMALEKRFALRFTPKDLMQMRSLGHVVAVVTRRLDAARP
jgi:long-chain acyl-CoA synthetase